MAEETGTGIGTNATEGNSRVIHVEAVVGAQVTVPGGDLLLVADYVRDGADLILIGPDGTQVVIDNYFTLADPPTLVTAAGARVPGDLVAKLAGPMAPGQYAQAGEQQAEPIGQVETVEGQGTIIRADGTSEVLEAGVPIYEGDTITTAEGAAVGIIFADKTTLSIGEDARMVIDEMVFDPATKEGSQLFSLMQGAFVIASGEIGKMNPDDVTVRTPTATIGIRGTKYGISVDAEGGETLITVLEGTVVVSNDGGLIELNTIGQSTLASSFSEAPSEPFSLGAADLNKTFGAVLQVHPEQPPLEINTDEQDADAQGLGGDETPQSELEQLAEELAQAEAGNDDQVSEEELAQLAEELVAPEDGGGEADAMDQLAEQLADIETAAGGTDTVVGGGADDAFLSILAQRLDAGGDISGGLGDDTIDFGGRTGIDLGTGNVVIDLGTPTDVLGDTSFVFGSAGDDFLISGPGVTEISAGAGNDVVQWQFGTSASQVTIDGGSGEDTLTIVSSQDSPTSWSVSVDEATGNIIVTEASGVVLTLTNIENVEFDLGTQSDEVVIEGVADAGASVALDGGGGDDVLVGGSGADNLVADAGDDTIYFRVGDAPPTGQLIDGGAGNDTLIVTVSDADLQDSAIVDELRTLQQSPNGTFEHLGLEVLNVENVVIRDEGGNLVDLNAEAPTLTTQDASGSEDTAIPLDIQAALTDLDGSETLSVTISGVPSGASLSAGTQNADGTWTLTADQLDGLTITPPEDSSEDFTLTVTATATDENGDTASTSSTIDVTVAPEAPDLTLADATGNEDTAIALDIQAALDGTTGGETVGSLYVMEEGSDSILKVGLDGNAEVLITQDDIIAVTGKDNADMDDRGIAVDSNGNIYFSEEESGAILVKPADGGALRILASESAIEDATGADGAEPKALTLGSDGKIYVNDDKSDSILSVDPETGEVDVLISKADLLALPGIEKVDLDGGIAATSDGKLYTVSDGDPDAVLMIDIASKTVSAVATEGPWNELDGYLTIAPNGDIIVAGKGDDDGGDHNKNDAIYRIDPDTGETSVFLSHGDLSSAAGRSVDLKGGLAFDSDGNFYVAEENTDSILKFPAADTESGIDPNAGEVFLAKSEIADLVGHTPDLEAAITFQEILETNDAETISITISGVPEGATLSAGTDNGDGTWSMTAADLEGLTITPPENSDEDFTLTVTASVTDDDGTTASTTGTLNVTVNAVADTPELSVEDATGTEDTAIPLEIDAALTDLDGSETLSITISGVPKGATLSAGTDNGDGSWTLTQDELEGLTITPPEDSSEDFTLTVTATATEADGGDTATRTAELEVTVESDGEAPTVTGVEDRTVTGETTVSVHQLETDNAFPVLGERQAVDSDDINGVNMSDLTLANDHPVTITFEGEAAGFKNSVGYYKIDDDGKITDVKFIWENASAQGSGGDLVPGETTAELDVGAGDRFALFVVANGFNQNDFDQFQNGHFEFRDGNETATVNSTNPQLVFVSDDGTVTPLNGNVYHTAGMGNQVNLNPDGIQHAISGIDTVTGELMIGFEDLPGGGDNDFNDLLISVDVGPATARTLDPSTVAPNIDLADVDSSELASATIEISSGYQQGDELRLPDGVLNGSGITVAESSYNSDTGTYRLVLQGTAPVQTYENILSSLQFASAGNGNAQPGTRTITFQVTDSDGNTSNVAAMNLGVVFPDAETPGLEISGDKGDNVLVGDAGDDVISGGKGDDVLIGKEGDDTLQGDKGDDTLRGGEGADDLYGGKGNDLLYGDDGADTLYGDKGADELHGGAGDDFLDGGSHDDVIYGDLGADELHGGKGDDELFGGLGDDQLFGDKGDDVLLGGAGDDTLTGGKSEDVLLGGAGDDTLIGDGRDALFGGSGDDVIQVSARDLRDDRIGRDIDTELSDDITAAANADDTDQIDFSAPLRSGIDGGSGTDTLHITTDRDVTIAFGEGRYENAIDAIDNIEAIDLSGGEGDIHLALDLEDVIKMTDSDHELTIFRDSSDTVEFTDTNNQPQASAPGAEQEGFTTYTYFDDAGNVLAKIHVQDDPASSGT